LLPDCVHLRYFKCRLLDTTELILNLSSGILDPYDGYLNPSSEIINSQEGYLNPSCSRTINPLRTSESLQWNYKPPEKISESPLWNYKPLG